MFARRTVKIAAEKPRKPSRFFHRYFCDDFFNKNIRRFSVVISAAFCGKLDWSEKS
jgi:hypothetical protein